jgi:MoxR-like ATPase
LEEKSVDIKTINEMIQRESAFVESLTSEVGKVIVGQKPMVDRLLIGLLCNGHVLLEGVPGLAKTLAIKTLAAAINAKFQRVQFTPDLLPADLIGTMIYNQKDGRLVPIWNKLTSWFRCIESDFFVHFLRLLKKNAASRPQIC